MTPQEAIEIITNAIQTDNMTAEQDKALAIVQKATYKQIPMNPTKRNITIADETDYFTDEVISTKEIRVSVCPNCGNDLRAILNIPYPGRCLVCGQALDW